MIKIREENKNDLREIELRKLNLARRKLEGKALRCSNCNNNGEFDSISRLKCSSANIYLICGNCNHVEMLKKDKFC